MTEEVTISAASPVVDTKKTTTGATFTADILENIPTARDPWQIINMTPGVQAGLNVGGSSSGQQVGLKSRGTGANVQWNLEGGSITDLSSNSSPSYFNFDSFEQIQVTTGGGDVSVQSSGLSINLVTKSGSNVFKGSAVGTFENDATQGNNVTEELFNAGSNGFLSGNPIKKITNYSVEYGGPIIKNRLWFWGAADKQDINVGVLNFFDAERRRALPGADRRAADRLGRAARRSSPTTSSQDVQNCLSNDKTVIKNLQWKFNYQLNAANKFQYLFQSDNKYRNARGASATTAKEATTQQTSDKPWGLPLPTHSHHAHVHRLRQAGLQQPVHLRARRVLPGLPGRAAAGQLRAEPLYRATPTTRLPTGARDATASGTSSRCSNRTTGLSSRSLTVDVPDDAAFVGSEDRRHLLPDEQARRRPQPEVRPRLAPQPDPDLLALQRRRARQRAVRRQRPRRTAATGADRAGRLGDRPRAVPGGPLPRPAAEQRLVDLQRLHPGQLQPRPVAHQRRPPLRLAAVEVPRRLRPGEHPRCRTSCRRSARTRLQIDPTTGKKIQPFSNWSPRVSVTYDLFGTGKTQIHASGSYFYNTKITLANSLGGLFTQPALTWGTNQSSGACSTTAGAPCWTDANMDGIVQLNELIGTPTSSSYAVQSSPACSRRPATSWTRARRSAARARPSSACSTS